MSISPQKQLFGISVLLIIITVLIALSLTGGPGYQREVRHDEAVESSLGQIENCVNSYYTQKSKLPDSLQEMSKEGYCVNERDLMDPLTQKPIGYKVFTKNTYQLCAIFKTSTKTPAQRKKRNLNMHEVYNSKGEAIFVWHPEGAQCYIRTAQKDKT